MILFVEFILVINRIIVNIILFIIVVILLEERICIGGY